MNSAGVTLDSDAPGLTDQLRALSRTIEREPHEAVNYLLRAEEWLRVGCVKQAERDFQTVIVLAEEELRTRAWEYVPQAYIDRARIGLQMCHAAGVRGVDTRVKP